MALTVTFDGSNFTLAETGDDLNWADRGGGGSSAQDEDYPLEGSQCRGRKIGTTALGMSFQRVTIDLSAAGEHIGFWFLGGPRAQMETKANGCIRIRLGGGADPDTSPWSEWNVHGSDTIPPTNKWVRVWFDVDRGNPDASNGTFNPNDVEGMGAVFLALADPAGNFRTYFIDRIDRMQGSGGLTGTGSGGTFEDFLAHDVDVSTNLEGVVERIPGGMQINARVTIGTATSAVLDDSGLTIIFQDEQFCEFDFMGLTFDLQNASTDIDLTDAKITSAGVINKGDFIVTGTSGALDFLRVTLDNLRRIDLTSACALKNGFFTNNGQITADGSDLSGSGVSGFEDQEIIDAQDETSYDNSPTTEGSFVGGTGHAASDVLTMSDGSLVTVDAVSSGVVTQFTVDSSGASKSTTGVANTQVSSDGSGIDFTLTPEEDNLVDVASVVWNNSADPNGEFDNMSYTRGTNPTHAIEFGTTSPLTMTLTGITFSGYNASNGLKDSTFWVRRTSGTVTININGGSGNVSYKSDGATVVIVQNPVDTLVTILDSRDNSKLQNARVILRAADGAGDLPFEDVVTITRSGSVATVAHTAHGMVNNNKVQIDGADQSEYNGVKTISNVSANAYDFTVSGSPTTPATGTIIATGIVLEGLTDVNGEIEDTRTWSLAQAVTGRASKATSSPIFKDANLVGIVSTTLGLPLTQALTFDE